MLSYSKCNVTVARSVVMKQRMLAAVTVTSRGHLAGSINGILSVARGHVVALGSQYMWVTLVYMRFGIVCSRVNASVVAAYRNIQ